MPSGSPRLSSISRALRLPLVVRVFETTRFSGWQVPSLLLSGSIQFTYFRLSPLWLFTDPPSWLRSEVIVVPPSQWDAGAPVRVQRSRGGSYFVRRDPESQKKKGGTHRSFITCFLDRISVSFHSSLGREEVGVWTWTWGLVSRKTTMSRSVNFCKREILWDSHVHTHHTH